MANNHSNSNSKADSDSTTLKEAPFVALKGFLMGAADIVPGVSGGTMALIVGIYNRFINAISSVDLGFFKLLFTLQFKKAAAQVHWKFLAVLGAGIASAILFFTKVVPLQTYMFTHPELIFGLFFGLIVGSIFILLGAMDAFSWRHGLLLLAGVGIGLWVVTRVPADTPTAPWFIFLSGSVAICAMVLPGISGSYILLILRKYEFILNELSKLGTVDTGQALLTLAPFVIGAVAGLMLFARLLSWLLDRFHGPTLAVLIGFLIGSLYVIWPYQQRSYSRFVSETKVIDYDAAQAERLRVEGPNTNQPEYERLGDVINPDASFSGLKKVQLQTVRQKLSESRPYVPFTAGAPADVPFWPGVWGISAGVALVFGLNTLQGSRNTG